MLRREDRSSDRNRRRSRFDREPSPKRYRRDGKLESERLPTDTELDKDQGLDQRHPHRLQDPLPLEASLEQGSKFETSAINKESENKSNEPREGTKHSSDPTKIPRSRSYFQHDDRGSVGQNGRSYGPRTGRERGWWRDSKEEQHGKAEDKTVASDSHRKDEKAKDNWEDNRVWRHDGYFEMEANPNPPVRKRPSFREQKISADPEKHDKVATDPKMPNHKEPAESGKRDERWHSSQRSDRPERSYARKRELNSRDRYGGASTRYGGRERITARQGYHPTGGRVEKWKHDLYNEANRSPTPKNEEDQISKIEALLAS
ncbi:hypothetical protein CDL12_19871 [Handroanthus impetiginosus]|uniref:Btz domain-containing protein n=1 Tax=Handroanthus impetiginosus TaxID=429701 RepID=A0A2G9GQK5_9LAMI|nr:hypothetical protein CDL12_19871 [Handroanthus impetiginosus]